MIDAERLLRRRGLAKRHISRRARLCHHTYTWHRILDESTYVLRSHRTVKADLNSLSPTAAREEHHKSVPVDYSRLDDFLRLEPEEPQSMGEATAVTHKDNESGLRDIHLEDSREFEAFFLQIYGVAETWLSLLSQTTRLANVVDTVKLSKECMSLEAQKRFEKRQQHLENKICAFAAANPGHNNEISEPSVSMVRALNYALVIFFYRRVKDVNPWILQSHVQEVASALKEFETSCQKHDFDGPGCPWPAFMAGCEALKQEQRDYFSQWFEIAISKTSFPRLSAAKACMEEVWNAKNLESQKRNPAAQGQHRTWIEVCHAMNCHLLLS